MTADDLPQVKRLSDAIYDAALSESAEVYAEKRALYPAGCFLLVEGTRALGYLLTHPWLRDAPPKIDRLLDGLPEEADCYYIHDLALLSEARGMGAAHGAMVLVQEAMARQGLHVVQLVAVGGAERFWRRMGFARIAEADAGYGADACVMEMCG